MGRLEEMLKIPESINAVPLPEELFIDTISETDIEEIVKPYRESMEGERDYGF